MLYRSRIASFLRTAWLAAAWLLVSPASAALLEGVLEPGELAQAHAKEEANCDNCHLHFKKAQQDEQCVACHSHENIGRDLEQKHGFHGKMKRRACKECHADHKGRKFDITYQSQGGLQKFEKDFDHDQTEFELKDKHKEVKCDKCHLPKKKHRDAPLPCYGCHKKDDKHKGALGEKCDECHNAKSWKEKDVFYDHDKTRFPLKNSHADPKVSCVDCHPNNHYKKTPIACVECHKKDDDKNGHHGRYGVKCESCHTDKDWKTLKFDHDRDTKYPLKGKHKTTKCDDCHTGKTANSLYKDKTPTECIGCHKKDDKHKGSEGDHCEKCHTEKNWKDTPDFDHNKTKFPLKGGHADPKVKCEDCHKSKVYTDAPKDCWSCHKNDDDDNGHKGRYGKKCEDCHVEKNWKTIKFDHDRDTKYPLRGKHKTTKCDDCHTGKNQNSLYDDKLKEECIACHKKDDKHKGKEGDRCEKCHWERDWKTTKDKFDHGLTRFPLLGKHADPKVKCNDCHKTQEYSDAKIACWACHEKDDKHKRRLGKLCEQCHNSVDWKRWDFNHDTRTHFKLDGAHKKLTCYDCHNKPTDDAKLPMACVACHENDDVHGGSFSRQCERCHVTKDWRTIKSRTGALDPTPIAQIGPLSQGNVTRGTRETGCDARRKAQRYPEDIASICNDVARPYGADSGGAISLRQWTSPWIWTDRSETLRWLSFKTASTRESSRRLSLTRETSN
jgi:Cytochrome c3